tara:strand:+ start:887 stop:1642 length:756 start_codon:yes stop_codon:yes gene_type:complete
MDLALKISKEYGKGYLSYSSIKLALQDMRLFEMKMRDQLKFDSPALHFGKLYDCMLLTPEDFDNQFIVADDTEICEEIGGKAPKRTKAYAEWIDKLKESGKAVASLEDIKKAKEMIDRLKTTGVHKIALEGDKQHEFNDFIGDVPVRGFLDVLGDGYITDSKTTQKLSKFRWSVKDFGYDIQAYMYSEVLGTKDFRWVAQEKAYPYAVGLYYASEDTLEYGRMKFNKAVERITEFLENGTSHDEYYETDTI